jgi:hypothetical protein
LVIVAGTYVEAYPQRRIFIGNGAERARWPQRQLRGDLVVNGVHVGFIEDGEAMVLDLRPGTYTLSWKLRDVLLGLTPPWAVAQEVVVALGARTTTIFSADAHDGTRIRATFLSHALGGPIAQREGIIETVLRTSEHPASMLARSHNILSPQEGALGAIPGASLAGR